MPVSPKVVPSTFSSDNETHALSGKDVGEVCSGVTPEKKRSIFFLGNAQSNGNLGSVGLADDSAGMVPLSNEQLQAR